MSVEALAWVFHHSESRLGTRLVLLALADFSQEDGGDAFPSVATLAAKARVSKRSARTALRRLEELGEIVRTGTSRHGTTVYAIRMGAAESAARAGTGKGGRQKPTAELPRSSPDPSVNSSGEPSSSSSAREPTTEEDLPRDFPIELRDRLDAVWLMIERVAEAKPSSVRPTRGAVARAIATFPDRDHIDAASDLEQWLIHGTGRKARIADVVQSYRRALAQGRRVPATAEPPPAPPAPRYDQVMRR